MTPPLASAKGVIFMCGKLRHMTTVAKQAISNSDRMMLKNARKSIGEIAEITCIPAQNVAARMQELLEAHDWMTDRQQERLLIMEMEEFIQNARDMLENADLENYAPIAAVVLKGMTTVGNRMDSRKSILDDDINKITMAQGRLMGQVVDIALTHVRATLKERYPETDDEEIDVLLMEGMTLASRQIDKAVLV